MNIEMHGTGRAAGALTLAMSRCGHIITSVHGRNAEAQSALAERVDPQADVSPDLRIIAVSDHAIGAVAGDLAHAPPVPTVHISGATSVRVLDVLADIGGAVGSFHPLQTLTDAERGAAALAGSWIAITTGDDGLEATLADLARSLGCTPFTLDDAAKPAYHAAASAASNYTNAALDLAQRLFVVAGVPFEAAEPLVASTVANAFDQGAAAARTGPVARGDHGTIDAQKTAASATSVVVGRAFDDMTAAALTLANEPGEDGAV